MAEDETKKSALIIGASRGLGLGLTKELLARGWLVTATVRSAARDPELQDYATALNLDTLDINNLTTINPFLERVKSQQFDLVYINAGILGPEDKTAETVTQDEMSHLFMTNAISPVRLAYKLLPLLTPETGVLALMTSVLGSIALHDHGSLPLYSASKAALNQLTRGLAAEPEAGNITVLSIHPGWVRTDMGGPNGEIDVATSVKGIIDVVEDKAGSKIHEYLDYKGETIPW